MQYMQVQCAADAMHIDVVIGEVKLQMPTTSCAGQINEGKWMHDASKSQE